MEEGPDFDLDLGQPPQRTADLLLRIAAILKVEPSFFLGASACPALDTESRAADELGELLRLFRTIEDANTRRAALNLVRLLQSRSGED